MIFYQDERLTIHQGDNRDILPTLPEKSVHCCVTSPPYFGLRDYGNDAQIGLEKTPDEYVAELVKVFREVRRVLRDDGTLWLNLGDSYAGSGKGGQSEAKRSDNWQPEYGNKGAKYGLKSKDLIGIPWRVAFALQADGWYLRQDIIWHKPNPMPESVTDRCTKSHEYIFLLSKSAKYYFNSEAMKERASYGLPGNVSHRGAVEYDNGDERHRTKAGLASYAERQRSKRDSFKRDASKRSEAIPGQSFGTHRAEREEGEWDVNTRNRRSVWTVATRPYSGAHFATFPPELIKPCIQAGCPEVGTVLEPFAGSGTTLQVAEKNGCKAVGIEMNPEYCDLIVKRIGQRSLLGA